MDLSRRRTLKIMLGILGLTTIGAYPTFADLRDKPVLEIGGLVEGGSSDKSVSLTLEQLLEFPQTTIRTSTIWTEGVQEFVGVELSELMGAVAPTGSTIRATAVNDYSVDIPMSDAVRGGAVVAHMRNGNSMSVRDKGPLWIIYPFDSDAKFRSELVYSRSIWQLERMDILE